MPVDPLHHPHDGLFKLAFSNPLHAAAAFQAYLPAEVTAGLDFSRLTLEPGHFVDDGLRQSESDLLFRLPCHGEDAFVYLLFEHQSRPDRWLALRLLHYQCRIWEQFRSNNAGAEHLPVIIPVVLAQCDGQWTMEPRFSALFHLPEERAAALREHLPDFCFGLIDLAALPWGTLRGTPFGITAMAALKAEREANRREELLSGRVWDEERLLQSRTEEVIALLHYILSQAGIDKAKARTMLKMLRNTELSHTAMTAYEELIADGIEIGMERGIETGMERGIEKGMERGALLGRIQSLEDLLGRVETPPDALAGHSSVELQARYLELKNALRAADSFQAGK